MWHWCVLQTLPSPESFISCRTIHSLNSFVQNWRSFGGVYYFLLDWWSFDDQKSKHHLPTGRFHTRNINNIFCEHFLCLQTNLWPDGAKKGKKGRIGTKSWLIEQSYVKHNFLLLSDKMLRNSILSKILNTWRRRSLNFNFHNISNYMIIV